MLVDLGVSKYMEYMRDENGDVYGFIYHGSTYFLEKNALGDVQYLLDGSGNVLAKYTYDEWGKVVSVTDANGNAITSVTDIAHLNPFRYRSYYYDEETGLYYVSSRYYDPEVGRWINADNMITTGADLTGLNLFAYCGNNPINNIDPTGNCYYGANGQWCHDNWEYIGGYQRLPDPGYYQGTTESGKDVYIAPDTNYSTPPNGVKVVDSRDTNVNLKTGEHDPSIQIRDSYKISNVSEQNQILDFIDIYNTNNPSVYNWERSRSSLIKEWEIHNVVCWIGYAFDSTAHVDFNVGDEGKGYITFFWEKVIMN